MRRIGSQNGPGRPRKVEAVSEAAAGAVPAGGARPVPRAVLTRRRRRARPVCRSRSPAPAWWVPAGSGSPAAPPLIPRSGRGYPGRLGRLTPPAGSPPRRPEGGRPPRRAPRGAAPAPPSPPSASPAARASRRRRVPSAARQGCAESGAAARLTRPLPRRS